MWCVSLVCDGALTPLHLLTPLWHLSTGYDSEKRTDPSQAEKCRGSIFTYIDVCAGVFLTSPNRIGFGPQNRDLSTLKNPEIALMGCLGGGKKTTTLQIDFYKKIK